MKNIGIIFLLLIVMSGHVMAGSGYDTCTQEEKTLKAREASECHGIRYLLNPSACFATQKTLKEYKAGKCRQIGVAENTDFSVLPVAPEKKGSSTAGSASEINNHAETVNAVTTAPTIKGTASPVAGIKAEPETDSQDATIEQLKAENARLKAEISRLTTELEQFGKACR
jgi:hypothetical protein